MLTCQTQKNAVGRELVHILPHHGRDVKPHPRFVQLNNVCFKTIVHLDLAVCYHLGLEACCRLGSVACCCF